MSKVTYQVPNISCNHCVHTIKTELAELAGIQTVEADAQTKIVQITYQDPATPQKIETLLAELGYPVQK